MPPSGGVGTALDGRTADPRAHTKEVDPVSRYARAALAAAAAGALLTTSSPGYATWHQALAGEETATATVRTGPVSVEVTGTDGTSRTLDPGAHGGKVRAVVGESIRVQVPVSVRTRGAGGILQVEVPAAAGDAPLAAELAETHPRIEVVPQDGGAPVPLTADGRGAEIPAGEDDRTYLLRWTTSTRATRDGRPAGRRNGWGAGAGSLQGASVGARPLTLTLTPHGGTPGHAQAVVPAIEMDTTAVSLTTSPSRTTTEGVTAAVTRIRGLGAMPLTLAPGSIGLAPLAPTTAAGLRELRRHGLGVEVTWGDSGCGAPRWVVPAGGFTARASAAPKPVRGATAGDVLPAGGSRQACLRLTGASPELVRRHAGHPVQARTTWISTSPAPATWRSTATSEARLTLPVPPPAAATCRVTGARVALRWSWPEASSTPPARVEDTTAVARWVLLARSGSGAWRQIAEIRDGDGREHRLPVAALGRAGLGRTGSAQVRVRAIPSAPGATAVDGTRTWTVGVRDGRPTCGAVSGPTGPAAADRARGGAS